MPLPLFRCHQMFDPDKNTPVSCMYHPESFTGETAQRWTAPGENHGQGGKVHYFYWCCGSHDVDAPGCSKTSHETYD